MNKGALRAALKLRLKLPETADPLLPDATLDDFIRQALNDFSREYDWAWLLTSATLTFSTTTGLAPLPSGYVRAKQLSIGTTLATARVAQYCELGQWLDLRPLGSVFAWTEQGTNVALCPIPSVAPVSATLWYIQIEPALASDANSPLMPEIYQDAMLARAAYHAEIRRGNFDVAPAHDNEYQLEMKKMRKARVSGPRRVVVSATNWASW